MAIFSQLHVIYAQWTDVWSFNYWCRYWSVMYLLNCYVVTELTKTKNGNSLGLFVVKFRVIRLVTFFTFNSDVRLLLLLLLLLLLALLLILSFYFLLFRLELLTKKLNCLVFNFWLLFLQHCFSQNVSSSMKCLPAPPDGRLKIFLRKWTTSL